MIKNDIKIYTGYFARYDKYFNDDLIPISISLSTPNGIVTKGCLSIKELAPSWNILKEYKNNGGDEYLYSIRYYREILSKLDPNSIVEKIREKTKGSDAILLCYEKSTDFCHRHLVSAWLRDNGYECEEYEK